MRFMKKITGYMVLIKKRTDGILNELDFTAMFHVL